jgi:putative acetyltransferase
MALPNPPLVAVRDEGPGDVEAIRNVLRVSFPTDAEARLVDALRAAGRLVLSLVAVDSEGEVVGHVAISPVELAGASGGVAVGPVATLPELRRRGIAARLVRDGLALCAQRGLGFVVVLGAPPYYGRFGFRPASRWSLRDEFGGGDAFQVLELRPGALPAHGGLVRYGPEFAAVAI